MLDFRLTRSRIVCLPQSVVRMTLTCAVAIPFLALTSHAGSLAPGHVVVVRVGDGAAPLTSAATAVFLDEYGAGSTPLLTIALPTAASGSDQPLTNSGTATSEGFLALSADNQFLTQIGYGVIPGTSSVTSSMSSAIPRVVAVTSLGGLVSTSTALTDAVSGGNPRSVASTDGVQLWLTGSAGGARVTTIGSTTSTQLTSTAPTNQRVIGIFNGQLYVTSASGSFFGVGTIGTGLPTTSGQTIALLSGFPTTSGPSSYDYFLADANTLYVADDRTSAVGGIQKWTQSGGTWSLLYTLHPTSLGCRGLTGAIVSGTTILWATTTQSNANQIVRVVDAGASSPFTVVATAAANTAFRGIRFLPIACGTGPDCNGDGITDACDITLGLSGDANENAIPDDCEQNGGTPFCFGDSGCPCGNNSAAGAGEGCSYGSAGAMLLGTGQTQVSADTLVLTASNLPPPPGGTGFVLFFQGDTTTEAPFNDGKRCVTGNQVRLGTKAHTGTSASYPQAGDPSISVRGGVPMTGGARAYQAWYRSVPGACGTFSNLTNGVSVVWMP